MAIIKRLTSVLTGLILSGFVLASPLKIAFVYPSPVGNAGWSYSHDQGRIYLERIYQSRINTSYKDLVPTGRASKPVIQEYAQLGYDLVFTTSKDFSVQTSQVAESYPQIHFVNIGGYRTSSNLSEVQVRGYQGRYLTGMIAGGMTKTKVIGFVAAFPIPEVVRGLNAFTLGVRETNPEAVVKVRWNHSWYNPENERKLAEELISEGADILTNQVDSPAILELAEEKGVYTFGNYSDMSRYAPNYHLTSVVYNWGPVYEAFLHDIMKQKEVRSSGWLGLKDGAVVLSQLNPRIPKKLVNRVKQKCKDIISGEYIIFQGPIQNQRGWTVVKNNKVLTDDELLAMSWYVKGIDGRMPLL